MASKVSSYAPLPSTSRGHSCQLDSNSKSFLYTNGRSVVIRDLLHPELSDEYTAHSSQTTVARYSPSGYYIASADIQGNVKVWDTTQIEHLTKTEIKVFSGAVKDLAWDSESKRIIAVGEGKDKFGHAFLFDSASSVGEISGHSKVINSVSIRPNRPFKAVTASDDNTVNFYQGVPYKFVKSLRDHSRFVQCVRYSPDGAFFASCGSDGKIYLYEGKEGEKIAELSEGAHTGTVFALSWSPDSKNIISSSADSTVKLWDISAKKCTSSISFASGSTSADSHQVGCLWTDKTLLSVSLSGEINYIDKNDFTKASKVIHGHQKGITALTVCKDKSFYTGSYDGRVLYWDATTQLAKPVTGNGHNNQVVSLCQPTDKNVISIGMDDSLRSISGLENAFEALTLATNGVPNSMSSNGTLTLVTTLKNQVLLFDNKKLVGSFPQESTPTASAISNTGKECSIGYENGTVKSFQLSATGMVDGKSYGEHRGQITGISYSPNGKSIAISDANHQINVYDSDSKSLVLNQWVFHSARVNSIQWGPDSNKAVSGSLDTNIELWSTETPMKHLCIKGAHLESVVDVCFLDNNTIVSVGQDAFIKVVDSHRVYYIRFGN